MAVELTLLSRVAYRGKEITGARQRDLLALLAADLRAGCGTGRLVEGLWPEARPEHPTKAVQILVSRTRSQLGPDLIASTPTGYRLALAEDQVDAAALLRSAADSARQARAGNHRQALANAEQGLALWEGTTGGGETDDPVAALRRERARTHRSLVRARALALSRLGRHAEAVEALAEVVRDRPRDEEALLELIRSEARTADPSAALTRYDAYRRALRDELGTDPGRALRDLHQQLLRDDRPAVRQGVPYDPNPLLGRDGDLAAVAELLRTSRVTSIVGTGGLGKTRLAHALSRRAEQRIVRLVALAGVSAEADVAAEVATAVGLGESLRAPATPRNLPAEIAAALGPGPALLVLDNCEHLIGGVAELVGALVALSPDLRVLTTSRAPLDLSSESVYQLPELDLPTTVELFRQRATAARPDVALPADQVEELCGRLDGLPLAVELAAARVRVMSVAEIARRLDDRFAVLRGGSRDAPERHRTLQAVVEWSWNLLDPPGREATAALSIFPDGFTAAAADHLLGGHLLGGLLGGGEILGLLAHLVDQSLLKVADTGSGTRFRMLETIREFGTAKRVGRDDVTCRFLDWTRDFGVAHYESLTEAAPFTAAAIVRAEEENLVHGLRLAVDRADGATVAAAFAVLGGLWMLESRHARMAAVAEPAGWVLSHFRPVPGQVEVTRAAATLCRINMLIAQGAGAVRSLVTLRRLPPAPPDTAMHAAALVFAAADPRAYLDSPAPMLAGVAHATATYVFEGEGEIERALESAGRILELLEDRPLPWMRLLAHARIAELCLRLEQVERADRHLRAALRILEEHQTTCSLAAVRWMMALTAMRLGAVDEAERWLDLAVRDETVGSQIVDAGIRAEFRLARGDIEAGLRLWRVAARPAAESSTAESSGTDLWAMENRSAAVIAHARHGRLDLVTDVVDGLAGELSTVLAEPSPRPATYVLDYPAYGTVLLALAMADLTRGGDGSAARMIALAERFRFLRTFQPTMSADRARRAAEEADEPAYTAAVSAYASLRRDELRTAALAALRERPSFATPPDRG